MATSVAATVTRVVTEVITRTAASATPSATLRAAPQGGVLEGANPAVYDPKNPILTFIIQAGIIITVCRLLHFPLSKIRQPRVIAEVVGGIILGPSVMGHVPGFTNAVFPAASIPNLNLVANLGLVLFLFLVGLEVDLRFLVSNWRIALSVGALGMALPFGLGCAIAYGLYNQFRGEPGTTPISFGVFMLFVGVAMAITAFPVLCRILTELKLLGTPVGVIVLSAGVGNDVVGWILLALCVALVNAGSGLTAVWVLLVCLGYVLILIYAIRPAFLWILHRTGSIQNGPTQAVVGLTLLMALASAFFTGIIGVHPIFGGFMIGLICPHQGGFAIKITEKVEDLVSVLFLPLYFALSGLSTNLGLLDSGITWAYVIGVVSIAFSGKVIGGTLAAKFNGLVWRESLTIGVLMSCKGLVELIVLNIGLQAKILSTRTFTIFVVMALITTFATTPLTKALYPHWYQIKIEAWKRGETDWEGNRLSDDGASSEPDGSVTGKRDSSEITRLLAYLRLDNMPGVVAFVSLLAKPLSVTSTTRTHPTKQQGTSLEASEKAMYPRTRPLQVHGLRLTQLTERESSVMKVSEMEEYALQDPVVNTFRTFGQLRNFAVSGDVLLVPEESYARTLVEKASDVSADMMLIPWSTSGTLSEYETDTVVSRFATGSFTRFVTAALNQAPCKTAIFVDNGFSNKKGSKQPMMLKRSLSALSLRDSRRVPSLQINTGHHIFLPYLGSDDDKAALRFVLQLAQDPSLTATLVQYRLTGDLTSPSLDYAAFFDLMRDSLPEFLATRVVFEMKTSSSPYEHILERARQEFESSPKDTGDLMVLGRNAWMDLAFQTGEMDKGDMVVEPEARLALGILAAGMLGSNSTASLLVVRA